MLSRNWQWQLLVTYATDLEDAEADKLGFTIHRSAMKGSTFIKKRRYVWSIVVSHSGDPNFSGIWTRWQTADLIEGHFTNHKRFDTLSDALNREL